MFNGYAGHILYVDLATGALAEEPTEKYHDWIGGRGLGLTLISHLPELASDLAEIQPIAISSGSLVASTVPLATRTTVTARNQISGGISYSSVGGDFGLRLKTAGYDAVVIRNASPVPVYLLLGKNGPKLLPASDLWGLRISEMRDELARIYPDGGLGFIGIGPAGENLVRISCLMVDRAHAAGWGGSGVIFGAKKLKAVVASGQSRIRFAFPKELKQKASQLQERLSSSPAMQTMKKTGTHGMAAAGGLSGKVPTAVKNIRDEYQTPEETQPFREEALKKWETRRAGCLGCPIDCLHIYKLPNEDQSATEIEGMHANSVRGFGPNLGVSDPEAILRMHWLANENGLDVDGLSSSMAFALECAENGILAKDQPGGVRLEWGDGPSLTQLTAQIVLREGLGAVLAEGAFRAAEQIGKGSQEFALTTKKVGINEQGIRSHRAWAIGIMTSNRGGGHLGGAPQIENRQIPAEDGLRFFNNPNAGVPSEYEGKGKIAAWTDQMKAIVDSLGLCYFAYGWYDLNISGLGDLAELYSLASGREMSGYDLLRVGLRIHTLERVLNNRLGKYDRRDDTVPHRFFDTPNSSGPYAGLHLDGEQVNRQLDEYYRALGWDVATGLPGEDCLRSFQLDEFINP